MIETQLEGVFVKPLRKYGDDRGWLTELYRDDEFPEGFEPTMGYLSVTKPGIERGPHEHVDQTDGFVFLNGTFELHLWENRPGKPERKEVHVLGENEMLFITIPPGVVHAYKNVSDKEAFVLNFPDRLYAGWAKKEAVDEIRHELDPNSRFKL
jgi:dTDP-4-dehydrorhamnose 3,5-epimerase